MPAIDHLIVKVNDLATSVAFYTRVLGFVSEGSDGPFTIVRVGDECQLQLAPWGTTGGEHYAFAVAPSAFEAIFARLRSENIAYGPSFDRVGSNQGPGEETGARGTAPTLYFFDPDRHLLEIRCYAD
jgi:catechol 2,3-dioxygenase-like lactoylglutathione lyase family enzyme